MASLLNQPTATFSQDENVIYFSSGSKITINRPANQVFPTILDTSTYEKWNTTNPHVTFPSASGEQTFSTPDTLAELSFHMTPDSKPTKVPIRIMAVQQDNATGVYRLDWQGQLLPQWFGKAERVQTVRSLGPDKCALEQWESMSGWGARVLDTLLGVRKQMDVANVKYAEDLKGFMESSA